MIKKKVIIEDHRGVKLFPVTSVENVLGIEDILNEIDFSEIEVSQVVIDNINNNIKDIKNELGSHKHSADNIVETNNKKFVTSDEKSKISTIDKKADKNHNHTEYAKSDHTHTGYAKSDHAHTEYAKSNHVHTEYAKSSHSHSNYADYYHSHSEYAKSNHSHSANDITETSSKKFVTQAQLNDINKINNKADKSELEDLKQSGVETNKILVDALNSKGVSASTSSTIKTNAGKVKNIKVGMYNRGDRINPIDITITFDTLWSKSGGFSYPVLNNSNSHVYVSGSAKVHKYTVSGFKEWEYNVGKNIDTITVDKDDNVYALIYDTIIKISPTGKYLGEFNKFIYDTRKEHIGISENGDYYIGFDQPGSTTTAHSVIKVTPSGELVWSIKLPEQYPGTDGMKVIHGKYLYVLCNNKIYKVSKNGEELDKLDTRENVYDFTVDKNHNYYITTRDQSPFIIKYYNSGSSGRDTDYKDVYEITGSSNYSRLIGIDVDKYGNLYVTGIRESSSLFKKMRQTIMLS